MTTTDKEIKNVELTQKIVFLAEIAQLLLNNDKVKEKAKKSPLVITPGNIQSNFPELEGLPSNLPLFKFSKNQYGSLQYLGLCLYQDNGQIIVVSPDMNASPVDGFTVESFRLGRDAHAVVSYGQLLLKIAISASDKLEDELFNSEQGFIEGSLKDLKLEWLADRPVLEIPLRNLPLNVPFTIIGKGKTSRQYETALIDIKDEKGNEYLNVITNSFLSQYSLNGGKKFRITELIEEKRKLKDGKIETITKANIEPLDGKKASELNLTNL